MLQVSPTSRFAPDGLLVAPSRVPTEMIDRRAVTVRSLIRVAVLLGGSLLLSALVFELLDPPRTYNCEGEPPPDAAAERDRFLPGALTLTAAAGIALGVLAWHWAGERMVARGRPAHPGRLAASLSPIAVVLWAYPLIDAFNGDDTGAAVFYGLLLGIVGLGLLVVVAVGLALLLAVVRADRRWEMKADSLTTAGAWTLLQFGLPAFTVLVAVRGTDTTIFC